MEAEQVDAAFLTDPVSIAYLTGFRTDPHERLLALVLRGGERVLVVPGLEAENAAAGARGIPARAWRDGEDPWRVVGGILGAPRRLAVEKGHLTLAAWERLQEVAGAPVAVDAGAELRRLRVRKSAAEVETLERAARLTDRATELILAELSAGRTELEVAAAIDHHVA